ncbi:hypothetical protein WA026_004149 [Henosepilachna vigintioctopunctata]|uniref:Uncharacterized protein n=1 Tax=Henosepilachna vigintioctopunctata TaxID=420089 RepID=A0AAW1U6M0_9CUCU
MKNKKDKSNAREVPQETEEWTGYSVALTYYSLLPVFAFCGGGGSAYKVDVANRSQLYFSFLSIIQSKGKLLKWASENLPTTWSSPSKTLSGGIPDLWKDGSLLCTLINMVVPGACPNPPKHWRKAPTHAQALAYKYLGVTPVFTETDFDGSFSPTQEKKFLMYLQELQLAMKNHSEGNENLNFSSAYLTKGMGLQTGEQYRKTIFYVYSNSTSSNCNNILVYIRGPYGTKGTATIPAFYNLNSVSVLDYSHKLRASGQILFKKETRRSFLKSIALDITSFVNLERKVSPNDVPIHVEMENDRAKVTYIPNNYGIYEINLITNGEILKGSPFSANIIESLSGIKDSFDSTEKILKELPAIRKKRIVSRYIDCIYEKIQLNAVEEDNRRKGLMDNVIYIVSNKNDSIESEISSHSLKALPPPQLETQHDSKVYPSEKFDKLEKINEDQNENDTENLLNDDYFREKNTLENFSSELSSGTASSFSIIPSVSVTEPEEELDIAHNNGYHIQNSGDAPHFEEQSKIENTAENCSECEEKSDIFAIDELDKSRIEGTESKL